MTGSILCRAYALRYATTTSYPEVSISQNSAPFASSPILSVSSSLKFPEPRMVGGWYRWPICVWVRSYLYLPFDQLWVYSLAAIHRKKKETSLPKLKAVKFMDISVYIFNLVWWHDHLVTRHLLLPAHDPSGHGQLTRFTVVDMESLPWNRPHVQSESSWLAHNFHATIVPVDALLHRVPMGQCCRIQCLVLGKIIMMSFLLPSACITM